MVSFGVEYYPHLRGINNVIKDLSHFQVTVPAVDELHCFMNLPLKVVLHSNLLNAFGENDWNALKKYKESIDRIMPEKVIEHASLNFDNDTKLGIGFVDEALHDGTLLNNLQRWEGILEREIVLENIPFTDVQSLLKLLTFSTKHGIEIVCDIPHLLISCVASGYDLTMFKDLITSWNPKHAHISGLDIIGGRIIDNHYKIDNWLRDFAEDNLSLEYLTLEQSSVFDVQEIADKLKMPIISTDDKLRSYFDKSLSGIEPEEYNEKLARNRARGIGLNKYSRSAYIPENEKWRTICESVPFCNLNESLRLTIENGDMLHGVESITRMYQQAKSTMSWTFNGETSFFIGVSSLYEDRYFIDLDKEEIINSPIDTEIFFEYEASDNYRLQFGIIINR